MLPQFVTKRKGEDEFFHSIIVLKESNRLSVDKWQQSGYNYL